MRDEKEAGWPPFNLGVLGLGSEFHYEINNYTITKLLAERCYWPRPVILLWVINNFAKEFFTSHLTFLTIS